LPERGNNQLFRADMRLAVHRRHVVTAPSEELHHLLLERSARRVEKNQIELCRGVPCVKQREDARHLVEHEMEDVFGAG
jgi:hypothetical protein